MVKKKKFQKKVSEYQSIKVSKKERTTLPLRKKVLLAVILLITLHFALCTFNLFLADTSFNNGGKAKRYGFYEQAVQDYRSAISLNPHEPRYHRELASVLARLERVEEAEREAEITYNLNPKNSLTVRSLISTYVDLAEIDPKYRTRAEELIAEAINQQPTNPQLYYEQALMFFKAEKDEEATEALKKAVELKPDYRKAKELLQSSPQNQH